MPFAYIDSQGNEVPIPGADALRLRIELGAVTDGTRFYDASQDRWAPAAEHEIYRTLKREVSESGVEGFAIPSPGPEPDSDLGSGPDDTPDLPPEDASDFRPDDASGLAPDNAFDLVPEDASDLAPDDASDLAPEDASDLAPDDAPDDAFGLRPDDVSDLTSDPSGESAAPEGEPEVEEDEVPDFGLHTDDFTLASSFDDGANLDDEPESPRWDVASELEAPFGAGEVTDPEETPSDLGEGLVFESSEMTGFDPGAPPSWMEDVRDAISRERAPEDSPETGDDSLEPSPTTGFHEEGDDLEARELHTTAPAEREEREEDDPYDRQIRVRGGPPQRKITPKGSGSTARLIALFGLVAVLGGGGWFVLDGWVGGAGSRTELSALPAELQPELGRLAHQASQRWVERIDSLPERVALPPSPGAAWLSGNYLSNASTFSGVRDYWVAVAAYIDVIEREDEAMWRAAFEEEVIATGMTTEDAALVRERGLVGWSAAEPDRRVVYDEFRRVIGASLALHEFLAANEAQIRYEPAAGGGSRDPVLEAVPATPELGEAIWERVGEITAALDTFGYLQQVETEAMLGMLREKLVATGIR